MTGSIKARYERNLKDWKNGEQYFAPKETTCSGIVKWWNGKDRDRQNLTANEVIQLMNDRWTLIDTLIVDWDGTLLYDIKDIKNLDKKYK